MTGVANPDVIFPDKISLGDGSLTDGDQIVVGVGSDLKIFHDGSDSRVTNTTGAFQITGNNDLRLKTNSGQNIFKATGSAVELSIKLFAPL